MLSEERIVHFIYRTSRIVGALLADDSVGTAAIAIGI
jgi:hypothetical protein